MPDRCEHCHEPAERIVDPPDTINPQWHEALAMAQICLACAVDATEKMREYRDGNGPRRNGTARTPEERMDAPIYHRVSPLVFRSGNSFCVKKG